MRQIVAAIAVICLMPACRRSSGEDTLKWSCARVERGGQAVATPDCLDQLQLTQSPVLDFYKAVPHTDASGKVDQYSLVEKDPKIAATTR